MVIVLPGIYRGMKGKQQERYVRLFLNKNHDELTLVEIRDGVAICEKKPNYVHRYKDWRGKKKK